MCQAVRGGRLIVVACRSRKARALIFFPFPNIHLVVQQLGTEEPPHQCGLLDPYPAEQGGCVGTSPGHLLPGKSS